MDLHVWYSNGQPIPMTLPFEYRTPKMFEIRVFGIWVSVIQLISVHIVTTGTVKPCDKHKLCIY